MNRLPTKEAVAALQRRFPKGCRVELVRMDDPCTRLRPGDQGIVDFVDDVGTIFVAWDNGARLGIALGADVVRKI